MNNREIKFRGQMTTGEWVYGLPHLDLKGSTAYFNECSYRICWNPETGGQANAPIKNGTLGQYTGLIDKNGKEVYEGDEIRYRVPYRTTQTHTGDNIPNGSYTEPMEPGIKIHEGVVVFDEGGFQFKEHDKDGLTPLQWIGNYWDLEEIKDAISYGRPDRFVWDDPEEGDLQYLITDCAKVETPEQLIEHLGGIEVIGNIYENPELLSTTK